MKHLRTYQDGNHIFIVFERHRFLWRKQSVIAFKDPRYPDPLQAWHDMDDGCGFATPMSRLLELWLALYPPFSEGK